MKPLCGIRSVWLVWAFLALLMLPGVSGGAEQKKEFTLHQVDGQVVEAMDRFRNLSIAGNVTTKQRESIEAAYKQFKKVYDAAVETAGGKEAAKKTPASEKVKDAAEQVIDRVAAIPEL